MTSEGTWRFVIPLCELTMARSGPSGQALLDSGLDAGCSVGWQGVEAGEDRGQSVVGGQPGLGEDVSVFGEHLGEEGFDDLAEEDRVGHLHHRGLEVDGEQDSVGLGVLDLLLDELVESGDIHLRGIDDLTGEDGQGLLEDLRLTGFGAQTDRQRVIGIDDHGLLVVAEVLRVHGGHAGLRVLGPFAHRVRVGLGEVLHGLGRAAVGVAFAQHRVDGRALDLVVACPNVLLLIGRRLFRVGGQVVALGLQFGDRGLQLRDGSRDVGQLDDVGIGGLGESAQLGQCVADLLFLGQTVAELGQHARGERDVSVSTSTPADVAKASMIGLSEYVARSGASSVRV
jgi:hypothetical protein